jgi:hypothetical protein
MPAYRLYRVDGAGKILSAEWLEAVDDDDALATARQSSDGGGYELWQQERMIARVRRDGTKPSARLG